jgi:hypothetical protein
MLDSVSPIKRLAFILVAAFVCLGCGSSSDGFVATQGTGASPGSLTFNFIKVQAPLQVPVDTTTLQFEFFSEPNGLGNSLLLESRAFAASVTFENVDPAVQSVVVTAFNANRATLRATVAVQVVAGQDTVVDFSTAVIELIPNQPPLLAVDPDLAGQLGVPQDAAVAPFPAAAFSDDQDDLRNGTLTVTSSVADLTITAPAGVDIGVVTGSGTSSLSVALSELSTPTQIQAFLRGVTVTSATGSTLGAGSLQVSVADGEGQSANDSRSFFVVLANALFLRVGAGQPFTTIAAALTEVANNGAPGSVITVDAGDFTGEGVLVIGDDPNHQELYLRGAAAGHSAGSNPSTTRPTAGTDVEAVQVDALNVRLDGLEFANDGQAVLIEDGAGGIVVTNSTFTATGGGNHGIRFGGGGGFLPNDITITNSSFTQWSIAVRLSGSPLPNPVTLADLTITGNAFVQNDQGVFLLDIDDATFTLESNGFFDQGSNHLRWSNGPPGILTVRNNEFSGNGQVRAALPPANILDARTNWWGSPAGAQPGQVGPTATVLTTNQLVLDPLPNFP